MHGLYPVPLEERVREALESVRPYMESHGGAVELVAIEDGVARIRLEGHCRGCSASASTLELGIRQALEAAAPDLEGLVVDGVLEEPTHGPPPGAVLLPMAGGGRPRRGTAAPAARPRRRAAHAATSRPASCARSGSPASTST